MRRDEFIEQYGIEEKYEDWFLTNNIFKNDLQILGWKPLPPKPLYKYHREFNELDIICTNPNFYTDGALIGNSRKSEIMASGYVKFKYNNNVYTDFEEFIKVEGIDALKNLKDIEWIETMDWIIVNKKQGNLVGQFDDWVECPTRKEVE